MSQVDGLTPEGQPFRKFKEFSGQKQQVPRIEQNHIDGNQPYDAKAQNKRNLVCHGLLLPVIPAAIMPQGRRQGKRKPPAR